jgi:hypothetical protein
MGKLYDFTFGVNFGYFDDFYSIYKGLSLDGDTESLDLFEYKYNGIFGLNPYISHIKLDNKKAKPLGINVYPYNRNERIPVINLSFNPTNSKDFTIKYLESVKEEVSPKLKKFIRILISGHGQSKNSIGTGRDNLNSGYITIQEIVNLIDFFLKESKDKITYLKIYFVACGANKVGTPECLYNNIAEMKYSFPFTVVGYDNKINMCEALNAKHDYSIQKFSTFYAHEFEGRCIYRDSFKLELQKIIEKRVLELPILANIFKDGIAFQNGRLTVNTLDYVCISLVDAIEYANIDETKKKYYSKLRITPKVKYFIDTKSLKIAKLIYNELVDFKKNFTLKAGEHYASIKSINYIDSKLRPERNIFLDALRGKNKVI